MTSVLPAFTRLAPPSTPLESTFLSTTLSLHHSAGDGAGVNNMNMNTPAPTHPDDSDMTLLLKPAEGIRNPRQPSASIRLRRHIHDSNIHLQFLCTPRSVGRSIQRLIKDLPLDTTPFAPKHEGDLSNACGGDGRKDVHFSSPQTPRI